MRVWPVLTEWQTCSPLNGDIFDFRNRVFYKLHNVFEGFMFDAFVALESGRIARDLVHEVVESHESEQDA